MTVEALRRGEPQVLAELLGQYGREIQGVAYLILRNRADAEDVLMDTLLAAIERGSSLRDPSAVRPWLLKIATNQALTQKRRFGAPYAQGVGHISGNFGYNSWAGCLTEDRLIVVVLINSSDTDIFNLARPLVIAARSD